MDRVGKIPDILRVVKVRLLPVIALGAGFACGEVELPCDIQDSSCQERIFDDTAALRGIDPGAFPTIITITEAELRAAIASSTQDVTPRPEIDAALVGLGLIPDDSRLEEVDGEVAADGIAAFYLPGVEEVVIVERASTSDPALSNLILAHEFVHLFQDRRFGLGFPTHATDAQVAYRTLVEGDATLGGDRIYTDILGITDELDWPQLYARSRDDIIAGLGAGEWRRAQRALPYSVGANVFANGGSPQALFTLPQTSFRSWLRGTPDESAPPPLACLPPAPPEGWRLHLIDQLGGAAPLALTRNLEDGSTLEDDRLAIYIGPGGESAAVWHLAAGSEASAQRIAQVVGGIQEGKLVRAVVAASPATKDSFQALPCGEAQVLASLDTDVDIIGAIPTFDGCIYHGSL